MTPETLVAAGITQPTRHQVAFVAKYTVNGHFNNTLGGLKTKGLVDYPGGGLVGLTEDGLGRVGTVDEPVTREELIERVRSVLREEPQRRVFNALVNNRRPMAREDLATVVGYTVNGHFNNTLGSLKSLGVVDYPQRGMAGLSSVFEALA